MNQESRESKPEEKKAEQKLQPPKPPPTRLVFGEKEEKDNSKKD